MLISIKGELIFFVFLIQPIVQKISYSFLIWESDANKYL